MECDVFGNRNFLGDLEELIGFLKQAGYRDVVMYDNYGNLYDACRFEEVGRFLPALFHQVTSKRIYLDLLFGTDLSEFFDQEITHFAESGYDEVRQHVAAMIGLRWRNALTEIEK
jgi:hypothetical protein